MLHVSRYVCRAWLFKLFPLCNRIQVSFDSFAADMHVESLLVGIVPLKEKCLWENQQKRNIAQIFAFLWMSFLGIAAE